ncbi:MAG: response regulator, partial [Leptolyngbya sp. SIO3F4]|nr:response regulator [Leptolyngbya sp. SIO3F4]
MSDPLNVLVIEDSEDDTLLVIRELRRNGFKPLWERIETAQELEEMLKNRLWDIIISDYTLPNFSAPVALEIVKQLCIDTPFIVVAGSIGEQLAVEMMKAGAHDYVMKDSLARLP